MFGRALSLVFPKLQKIALLPAEMSEAAIYAVMTRIMLPRLAVLEVV